MLNIMQRILRTVTLTAQPYYVIEIHTALFLYSLVATTYRLYVSIVIYNKPSLNICLGTRHGYWVYYGGIITIAIGCKRVN